MSPGFHKGSVHFNPQGYVPVETGISSSAASRKGIVDTGLGANVDSDLSQFACVLKVAASLGEKTICFSTSNRGVLLMWLTPTRLFSMSYMIAMRMKSSSVSSSLSPVSFANCFTAVYQPHHSYPHQSTPKTECRSECAATLFDRPPASVHPRGTRTTCTASTVNPGPFSHLSHRF